MKPKVTTTCSKCKKVDEQYLSDIKTYQTSYVYKNWLPKDWSRHNTEDGFGPEPDKVFVLCKECEAEFQLSVRSFKPSRAKQ